MFEAMWINHPSFNSLVANNWNFHLVGHPQYVLAQNLKVMKQIFKVWNKTAFDDIRLKTQVAEKKVLDIQEILDTGPTDPLYLELDEAKASLHNWLQIPLVPKIQSKMAEGGQQEHGLLSCLCEI